MVELKVEVGVGILETLTSSLYEDPIILFREYVQNSLDASRRSKEEGKDISNFIIEITVDKKDKKIVIADNGYAIVTEMFQEEMTSISRSRKKKNMSGFRGIGRLSAMPFCARLIFESKAEGENMVNYFEWEGKKYTQILDQVAENNSSNLLQDRLGEIAKTYATHTDKVSDHYFKVTIQNYDKEIEKMLNGKTFMIGLKKLLPLKYSEAFTSSIKIADKYRELFDDDLNQYMCDVKYNGTMLRKEYTNELIGNSGIQFIEMKTINPITSQKETLGAMWFSFNKLIAVNTEWKKRGIHGILVRSKNMLMGGNDSFADQSIRSDNVFTSYNELVIQLGGISGEFLISSGRLKDNARRDWFKVDTESILLRNEIADFMKRLYDYRYAASIYTRDIKKDDPEKVFEKRKKNAIAALTRLLESDYEAVCDSFYNIEYKSTKSENYNFSEGSDEVSKGSEWVHRSIDGTGNYNENEEEENVPLSEKDMRYETIENKIQYDKLMKVIAEFFRMENLYNTLFNKLRKHIREQYMEGVGQDESDTAGGAGISEQVSTNRTDEDSNIS